MDVQKDGRTWRVGGAAEVAWLAGRPNGVTVETALPLAFAAYATVLPPEGTPVRTHERALVARLAEHTPDQPWWLGYLDTGAHDVVFPAAPRVRLYWDWPYVLVEAGPQQALTWRTGHMRDGAGSLPDLVFPHDRSWVLTALWDDAWGCIGGPDALVDALVADEAVGARRVRPGQDVLPPGLLRD